MPSQQRHRMKKLIYRIDNESQKVCAKTVSQILNADRNPRTDFPEDKIVSDYSLLHNQFHQIILFTKELIENPLIQEPEFKEQFGIISEIIKSSKIIREELNRFESSADTISDPDEVRNFLNVIQNELVQIDQEFQSLDQMNEYSTRILNLWESILKEEDHCLRVLKHISQRIIHDSISQETFYFSSNQNLKTTLNLKDNETGFLKWNTLNQSIHSARMGAWLSNQFNWSESQTELIVISSLLKDIGKIRQINVFKEKEESLSSLLQKYDSDHPSLGAAISSGFKIHPVKLPELISQHHERADRSGFPRQLTKKQLSRESSLLTILTKLTEYYTEIHVKQANKKHSGSQLWCEAISKVIKDSEEGQFDKAFTNNIAESLGFSWQSMDHFSKELSERMPYSNRKHALKPAHYEKTNGKKINPEKNNSQKKNKKIMTRNQKVKK